MLKYDQDKDLFYGDDDDVDIRNINDLFTNADEVEVDPDTLQPDDEDEEDE